MEVYLRPNPGNVRTLIAQAVQAVDEQPLPQAILLRVTYYDNP
jgi:hypothetical protein